MHVAEADPGPAHRACGTPFEKFVRIVFVNFGFVNFHCITGIYTLIVVNMHCLQYVFYSLFSLLKHRVKCEGARPQEFYRVGTAPRGFEIPRSATDEDREFVYNRGQNYI